MGKCQIVIDENIIIIHATKSNLVIFNDIYFDFVLKCFPLIDWFSCAFHVILVYKRRPRRWSSSSTASPWAPSYSRLHNVYNVRASITSHTLSKTQKLCILSVSTTIATGLHRTAFFVFMIYSILCKAMVIVHDFYCMPLNRASIVPHEPNAQDSPLDISKTFNFPRRSP